MADNGKLKAGNSSDLQIYHDGTNSFIKDTAGASFNILATESIAIKTNNTEFAIACNKNGSVELYHDNSKKFETKSNGVTVTGEAKVTTNLVMNTVDNQRIYLGAGNDLQIYHNAGQSYIDASASGNTSPLSIRAYGNAKIDVNGGSETAINAISNGAVELYYDNAKKFETKDTGIQVSGHIFLPDQASGTGKVKLGNDSDLQIFHTGSNSFLSNATGYLLVNSTGGDNVIRSSNDVHLQPASGESGVTANANGAVELYYDNSKQFETTADGVNVQGHITLAASNNAPKITFDENGANDPKAEIQMDQVDGSNGHLIFKTEGSGTLTERMRIESTGAIRSGTSSVIQAEKFTWFRQESDANTLAYFHQGASADVSGIWMRHGRGLSGFSGKMLGFLRNDGTEVGSVVIGNSSTAFNTSSDYRLKENVTSITDGITRLKTLKPYRFNFKDDTTKPVVDGFFAHEVTAVPEAITGTKDEVDADNNPVYQSIDQSKLVPLLVAAVQELIGRVEKLEGA